jgi:hypothetical protein
MSTIDTKTAFDAIGMGFSMASGWMTINGAREWVCLTACAKGRANRRDWSVTAEYGSGKSRREASCFKPNSFRYEAADAAIAALIETTATTESVQ